jgi:VWFA-related protein
MRIEAGICAVFAVLGMTHAHMVAQGTRGAPTQQPPVYTERVEVMRLLLDARVLDEAGRPVRGLGVDDFTVKVGGKTARVESVSWEGGPSADPPPLEPAELLPSFDAPVQGRLVVFLFQKSLERSRIVGFMRMLIETRRLLDTLTPHDRVAVLSFDSRLQVWLDFTNDYARVRRVFERGILFERAAAVQESPDPSLMRRLDAVRAGRTYTIERALRRIGEALADLPGAKTIVLVGHGFGRLGLNGVSMENEYDDMRETLQVARASVFSLDVTDADYHSLEAGLQLVAEDTGGFFARTHIFHHQALDRLAGALAGHYVLFVELPALKRGVHRAEVKLTRAKGNVLAKRSWVVATQDTSVGETEMRRERTSRVEQSACPVTLPGTPPFVPPSPYPREAPAPDAFWHGTNALWTFVPANGRWPSLPRGERGYRQKVFLWRPGYNGRAEQWPAVTVTGRRLDDDAGSLVVEEATNAFHRDFGGWAMLVGVEIPTLGCWQLTATHRGEQLTFVVHVGS